MKQKEKMGYQLQFYEEFLNSARELHFAALKYFYFKVDAKRGCSFNLIMNCISTKLEVDGAYLL